jgi:hypothetical protein
MVRWAHGNFLTEALAVLEAPESAPTLPLPRARPASPPPRPPPQPVSSRPRPVVERNPVIVAPVHRPQKPRSEEAPVDLVVISETPVSSTRAATAPYGPGTDDTVPRAAGLHRGRKSVLWGALLLLLVGVATVLTLGMRPARLGESHAASLGAGQVAPATTPITSTPVAAAREALDAGAAAKPEPEPSAMPLEAVEPEPPSLAAANATPARKPASRSKSRPVRETAREAASSTASPARADSAKSGANPYAYR